MLGYRLNGIGTNIVFNSLNDNLIQTRIEQLNRIYLIF